MYISLLPLQIDHTKRIYVEEQPSINITIERYRPFSFRNDFIVVYSFGRKVKCCHKNDYLIVVNTRWPTKTNDHMMMLAARKKK